MFTIQRTLFFIVELLLTVLAELPFEQSFIGHPDTSVDHEGYPMFEITSEDSHIRCAARCTREVQNLLGYRYDNSLHQCYCYYEDVSADFTTFAAPGIFLYLIPQEHVDEPCSLISSGIPHLFQYQNSCYGLLTNSRIDYSEAVAYCQERGAELATLESEEEFLFIRAEIIDNIGGGGVWVGGDDLDEDGVYRWRLTGDQIEVPGFGWTDGHPDVTMFCVKYAGNGRYLMTDGCHRDMYVVCEQ